MTIRDRVRVWLGIAQDAHDTQMRLQNIGDAIVHLGNAAHKAEKLLLEIVAQQEARPTTNRDARMPAFIDFELSQHKALTEFKET